MRKTLLLFLALVLVLLICRPVCAAPGSSAFTYQGQLQEMGRPINRQCDLQFSLWDAVSGGTALSATQSVAAVTVSNGLFTVLLDFGPAAFNGDARWLEVAVRAPSGAGDYTTLAPRHAVTVAPYAIFAGGVNAAGISGTISPASIGNGTINSNMLATGAVTSTQLAPGAAAANLAASSLSAVPGGGMILSSNYTDTKLTGSGYSRIGKVDLGNVWERRTDEQEPAARCNHTAVWTGREMIVWGGRDSPDPIRCKPFNDGACYDPTRNTWTAIPTNKAPAGRYYHTAVWMGTEMILWGGVTLNTPANDGWSYALAANTWTAMSTAGQPGARDGYGAVWTGSEMILWGGNSGVSALRDGIYSYTPSRVLYLYSRL